MYTTAKKLKMSGKKPSHRNAIVRSLLIELIRAERLKTTKHKGKILKQQFDILVNKAKKDTDAARRQVEASLQNEKSLTKLYGVLVPRLADVNSGYTFSALTLPRKGDGAEQMIVVVRGFAEREKKSRLAKALERREEGAEAGSPVANIASRITGRKSDAGATKKATKKKESKVEIRRNSK